MRLVKSSNHWSKTNHSALFIAKKAKDRTKKTALESAAKFGGFIKKLVLCLKL
jgi:hypothetical protein